MTSNHYSLPADARQGRCELYLAIAQECSHPVVCMMNKISGTQFTLHYIKINLAIPARVNVEISLNFLGTGSTYRTLVSDDAFQSHLITSTE